MKTPNVALKFSILVELSGRLARNSLAMMSQLSFHCDRGQPSRQADALRQRTQLTLPKLPTRVHPDPSPYTHNALAVSSFGLGAVRPPASEWSAATQYNP
ncbi:MAG: hypothetical protein ACFB12_28020 [Leptolyngbyaceae cyanobacterium]